MPTRVLHVQDIVRIEHQSRTSAGSFPVAQVVFSAGS